MKLCFAVALVLLLLSPEDVVHAQPSVSSAPSDAPSDAPSESNSPSAVPSTSVFPSMVPSMVPSDKPSVSLEPSLEPSDGDGPTPPTDDTPSSAPSLSTAPSMGPSESMKPSVSGAPSDEPSVSMQPTETAQPSDHPTPSPTKAPTGDQPPAGQPVPTPQPAQPSPTPQPTPSPTPAPVRPPIEPIPFVLPITDCSEDNPCERCAGHCMTDDECEGDLVCWKKGYIASKIPFCLGTDWSLTDWCVIEPNDSDPIPYVLPVRDCSTDDLCERCEGHCQNDDECEGDLVCTQKDGRGANIPNCIGPHGDDKSLTEWCVNPEDIGPTVAPKEPPEGGFVLPVRDCSPGNKCVECEGHCSNDEECEGDLICHDKGYVGSPIPGCTAQIDWSWTEWCIEEPGPNDDIPFVLPVINCTTQKPCERCQGHCENDNECAGNLVCSDKPGPGAAIDGCLGPQDDSLTEWCINPTTDA